MKKFKTFNRNSVINVSKKFKLFHMIIAIIFMFNVDVLLITVQENRINKKKNVKYAQKII